MQSFKNKIYGPERWLKNCRMKTKLLASVARNTDTECILACTFVYGGGVRARGRGQYLEGAD